MERISDRHDGNAGGVLAPNDPEDAVAVGIEVDQAAAAAVATQHTAWMLVNLLARFDRVITRIDFVCPDVPLAADVVPGGGRGGDLAAAVVARAGAVGSVPVRLVPGIDPHTVDIHLVVGPGPAVAGAIRVHGNGWTGAMSPDSMPASEPSQLPFGPYVAACLAAGHVFLTVRAVKPPLLTAVAYSVWSYTNVAPGANDGPRVVPALDIDAALGGVGAVGSTWLHAVWAVPSLSGTVHLVDSDAEGVTPSNLNRCPLFTRESLGHPKAEEAANICGTSRLVLPPHRARLQDVAPRTSLIVSAVDTNTARAAVQNLYPPRLLSASTHDLRAELLRCDPVGGGPCLRCHNPPEPDIPDDDLRGVFREMSPEEQAAKASELNITIEQAFAWALHGECGYASDRLIGNFRASSRGTAAFAVGFVSVLAGTMLAAQTVKELMNTTYPFDGVTCRAVFLFLDPGSDRNAPTAYRREDGCPMCDPSTPAGGLWRRRYTSGTHGQSPLPLDRNDAKPGE